MEQQKPFMPAKKTNSKPSLKIVSPFHHETIEFFSHYYSQLGSNSQVDIYPTRDEANPEECFLLYGDRSVEYFDEALPMDKPYFYIGTQESPSIHAYGIIETLSNPHALFSIFPETKIRSVLFFAEPNSVYSSAMYSVISKHLSINDIPSVKISSLNDISRYNTLAIKEHSLVIVLSAFPQASFIQRLSLICNQHQTPLIVSNLNAVSYGASVAFGLHPVDSAHIIYDMVQNYVHKGTVPYQASIPIESTIMINKDALLEQGFSFQKESRQLLGILNAAKIIEPSTREKIDAHVRLERHSLE